MRLILIFIFLSFSQIISAQTLTIKDAESHLPLEFVTISDTASNKSASTNTNGKVQLGQFITNGKGQVFIHLLGYESTTLVYSDSDVQLTILLQQKAFSLNPIVISANRWKQNGRDIPTKISSITKKDFQFQNPQTAADLLRSSGEVFIQKSQQGGGSPIIRGFSTNRLLYSIDGIRMNTAIFRSGNLQNVISLDPYTMESTEVLFGPGSVIYGSDAIGGVMSFSTLTPNFSTNDSILFKVNAATRFASANNEQTIHLDLNLGFKKWSFISSITQSDYDNLRMGKYGPNEYKRSFIVDRRDGEDLVLLNNNQNLQEPSAYSQLNLMQKIRFEPNENWNINYGFHYSETTEFDRYDRLIQEKDGLPRYAEWEYGPQKWMMNSINLTHSKKVRLYDQFSLRLAHQLFEESRINRNFNDSLRNERVEKVNAYSINLDFKKEINAQHRLFYGLEGIFNQVDSKGEEEDILSSIKSISQSRYPNSNWFSSAFYLTEQYRLTKQLILHGGIRYSWYALNSTFDTSLFTLPFTETSLDNSAINGSFGVVYHPTEKLVLSLNISTGFRAPNIDDIGKIFDSEPFSIVVPNPELKNEYAYNFDYSIAKIFGENLKVDLTLFYTFIEDALVRRDFTLNGQDSILYEGVLSQVQAIQNAAKASVYGAQIGLEIKINKFFSLSSQLNYQKGEEELDDGSISTSRHAAPLFGVSRLNFKKGKLKAQFYAEYSRAVEFKDLNVGERGKSHIYAIDKNGNPHSPAWYTLNLKGSYIINKNFTATLGIENITDQRYKTYSSGIASAGRNLMLGVRAAF